MARSRHRSGRSASLIGWFLHWPGTFPPSAPMSPCAAAWALFPTNLPVHERSEEPESSGPAPDPHDMGFERLALMAHRAPTPVRNAVDPAKTLTAMRAPARGSHLALPPAPEPGRKRQTEPLPPEPHRLVAPLDPALLRTALAVLQANGERYHLVVVVRMTLEPVPNNWEERRYVMPARVAPAPARLKPHRLAAPAPALAPSGRAFHVPPDGSGSQSCPNSRIRLEIVLGPHGRSDAPKDVASSRPTQCRTGMNEQTRP